MAIKLNNLQQLSDSLEKTKFFYKDLHLDIEPDAVTAKPYLQRVNGNDIKFDTDIAAIENSIRNLFGTIPGQRFLFPKYGLNLNQFLFEPMSTDRARSIANTITEKIELYEPRVKIALCEVLVKEDEYEYDVILTLEFPDLDSTSNLTLQVDSRAQTITYLRV